MTDEPRTHSIWKRAFEKRLRWRFTVMGVTLAAMAVGGLLVVKGIGWLAGGQDGGLSPCALAIKSAEAHETDCKDKGEKPNP